MLRIYLFACMTWCERGDGVCYHVKHTVWIFAVRRCIGRAGFERSMIRGIKATTTPSNNLQGISGLLALHPCCLTVWINSTCGGGGPFPLFQICTAQS